ncbi:Zinc finger CW-type PWWP domain protein 2 like protein [Argiope bruennichi]|uniref:Zinc finger CW-type PWWP domain protein 2 like protein n=1 Tax=Argiope bruennichi TaxID=94029 RepID=A0A8T0DZ87_ARGBR|nr:Zinc finger CW-type PWWP domain protein 2 like protein [Argiope bruennichi]
MIVQSILSWPAIIEADPDLGEFHQQKGSNQEYHVVFLDKPPSRSWIRAAYIRSYDISPPAEQVKKRLSTEKYKSAVREAETAAKMTNEERLENYSFAVQRSRCLEERRQNRKTRPPQKRKRERSESKRPKKDNKKTKTRKRERTSRRREAVENEQYLQMEAAMREISLQERQEEQARSARSLRRARIPEPRVVPSWAETLIQKYADCKKPDIDYNEIRSRRNKDSKQDVGNSTNTENTDVVNSTNTENTDVVNSTNTENTDVRNSTNTEESKNDSQKDEDIDFDTF